MLQSFFSDVNYAENELEALPTLIGMIKSRPNTGADATLYDPSNPTQSIS